MIPISLTLKGIYSYQQEQVIQFEKLFEGGLFGIFGAVGSGKSTILEAMTFALYGGTERLNQRDNRNYNMMNLKSSDLMIDFVFKNYDEHIYRFVVVAKRNSKDFEKVNTFERSAYVMTAEGWKPLENTNVEAIIGLSYDNFRRTIIIPQGQFQEFLQLGDKDRTQMLKEIFQLDKFEFFFQTSSLEKRNSDIIQHLNGKLSGYELLTEETLSDKKQLVAALSEKSEVANQQLQKTESEVNEATNLKLLFDELAKCTARLAVLTLDGPRVAELKKQIQDYEYCVTHFKGDISQIDQLKNQIQKETQEIVTVKGRRNECLNELATLKEQIDNLQPEYDHLDEKIQILREYQIVKQLIRLREEIDNLEKRITEGEVHVKKSLADKELFKKRAIELRTIIKEEKNKLPDLNLLFTIRNWFSEKTLIQRQIDQLQQNKEQLVANLNAARELHYGLLPAHLLGTIENDLPLTERITHLMIKKTEFQNERDNLAHQKIHFQIQVKLGEFADGLIDGSACPLCGSDHHPNILVIENVQQSLTDIEERQKKFLQLEAESENYIAQFKQFEQKINFLTQQLDGVTIQLDSELLLAKAHLKKFNWNDFDPGNENKINEQIALSEKGNSNIELLENESETVDQSLNTATQNHERFQSAIEKLKGDLIAKKTERDTLSRQLQKLASDDFSQIGIDEIDAKSSDLNTQIIHVKHTYESFIVQDKEHQQLLISLDATLIAKEEALEKATKNELLIGNNLNDKLKDSDYQTLDQIREILLERLDLDNLRKEVALHDQEMYASRQNEERLKDKTEGKHFNQEKLLKLTDDLLNLKEVFKSLNEQHIAEKGLLARYVIDFEQKVLLEKELNGYQHRASNLRVMSQLFKGSGFVNYVSTAYLQNLCQIANERFFKLTRQRLRLEINERNDFQVRDFLNDGKVRSVKTLSGGQTFQASLSLALALAESVQQQNKAQQNFFFLDEGFGSLDKENLQIVFETLKALRKENRIVGVISHVEELQQEIDVYLEVANDPLKGSLVRGSWQ